LLDIMLPEMDGIEVCEEIRKIPALSGTTIAFLTARGEDYSQIAGFEAGGDDYITKPVRIKVLTSRIRALLKRSHYHPGDAREMVSTISEDIVLDRERFIVLKQGEELILPKKEFELLNLLISKPGKVFTRDEIFHEVWGDRIIVGDRTIDVHIRKLREKIGEGFIQTVKGVGYKFVN
jgi:two-component system alkaline phosphatase synthesis response regulator PhoP